MKKLFNYKTLAQSGFYHILLGLAFAVIIALGGAYFIVASHAATVSQWKGTLEEGSSTSNYCLTSAGNTNTSKVVLDACAPNSSNQSWSLFNVKTATVMGVTNVQEFYLKNGAGTNECLNNPYGSKTNGTAMQVYTCNASDKNALWVWGSKFSSSKLSAHQLISVASISGTSSKCLDDPYGSHTADTKAQIWSCKTTDQTNQNWFEATPTNSTPPPTSTCVTSSFLGNCPASGDYKDANIYGSNGSNTYVANNVWSSIPGTAETLSASGPETWSTVTTIPNGNTSVVAAPQTRQDYISNNLPVPLGNFHALYSSFAETMQKVPGVAYDAGYDLWGGDTGNSNTNFNYEMMIWIDQVDRGTCGGATKLTTTTFGGSNGVPVQTWTLCRNGPASAKSEYIWYLSNASGAAVNEQTGSVDVMSMVKYLINHGYYASNYAVDQLDFTNEICSTGGVPARFTVSKFTVAGN